MKECRYIELFAGVGGFHVGLDRADKDFYKCCYDFSKILDFTKLIKDGKVNKDIKYKKYFLSGLIACKFPKNKLTF